MLTPAMMPVTAGKNRAKTGNSVWPESHAGARFARSVSGENASPAPRKNDSTDSSSTARIAYCRRIVQPAPTYTHRQTSRFVTVAASRNDRPRSGNAENNASVKPNT